MKMTVPRLVIPLAVVAAVFGGSPAAAQEPAHELEYNRDVLQPVLAQTCLMCHGERLQQPTCGSTPTRSSTGSSCPATPRRARCSSG